MGRKPPKQKSPKPQKSPEARGVEVATLRSKLAEFGFPEEDLAPLGRALVDFAERGWGSSGALRLPHFGVALLYKLSVQPHVVSDVTIRRVGSAAAGARAGAQARPGTAAR